MDVYIEPDPNDKLFPNKTSESKASDVCILNGAVLGCSNLDYSKAVCLSLYQRFAFLTSTE